MLSLWRRLSFTKVLFSCDLTDLTDGSLVSEPCSIVGKSRLDLVFGMNTNEVYRLWFDFLVDAKGFSLVKLE